MEDTKKLEYTESAYDHMSHMWECEFLAARDAEMDSGLIEAENAALREKVVALTAKVAIRDAVVRAVRGEPVSDFEQSFPGVREAVDLKEDNRDWEQSFDLYHKADMRGIKMWREKNPGNDLVMPDKGNMVAWLLEQWDALLKSKSSDPSLRESLKNAMKRIEKLEDEISNMEHCGVAPGGTGCGKCFECLTERLCYEEFNTHGAVEQLKKERIRYHALLQAAHAAIDPEKYGQLSEDIVRAIEQGCECE